MFTITLEHCIRHLRRKWRFVRMTGQVDTERSTVSDFTVNGNYPFEFFDYSMYHRRSQACAWPGWFRRKKWFENAFNRSPIHAAARIAYNESNVRTFLKVRVSVCEIKVNLNTGQADLKYARLVAHGLRGICAQIHQDLMELCGIRKDRRN